jgi:CubicO group peptidase (beta-lactamase class C family)
MASPLAAASANDRFSPAAATLANSVSDGRVAAASLCIRHGDDEFSRSFGEAKSVDAIFLLASISKPISVAALMTLYDQRRFGLDDPVKKFIPEFTGGDRESITIRQLLTHVSGLPDQLPENALLRKRHARLNEFIAMAIRTPLLFKPGTQYRYSSMGILLATEVAQRITGRPFRVLAEAALLNPLGMNRSALGLGRFRIEDTMRCQVEHAAAESGAGDPSSRDWDWNSEFWRKLAAPWGGAHGSAPDVARFFYELLHPSDKVLKAETVRLMTRNHNRDGLAPRGLGLAVGRRAGGAGCSDRTFGHTGSTGTCAWADPETDTVCVVLTTLPWNATRAHPAAMVSDQVAQIVR